MLLSKFRVTVCLSIVEPVMKTEPLFDHDKINETIRAAKLDRIEFFRRQLIRIHNATKSVFSNRLTLFRRRQRSVRVGLGEPA